MRIHFASGPLDTESNSPVLVVARAPFFAGDHAHSLVALLGKEVAKTIRTLGQRTKPGLLGALGTSVLMAGERAQDVAAGVLADAVAAHNSPTRAEAVRKVVAAWAPLASQGGDVFVVLEDQAHLLAAACAIARAMPLFQRKSLKQQRLRREPIMRVRFFDEDGTQLKVPTQIEQVVEHARRAAWLVDMPPSELDPDKLAAAARDVLAKLRGVKVQTIEGPALLRRGFGGIHAVGRAAKAQPRMLVATAKAHGGGKHPMHIALIGKGVTYDTGGLHLKARGMMEGMKSDMGGAAAMLGAFAVLAQAKLPVQLTLILCIVENAVGPDSYKPDDILTLHSGKTVEINNTDAEGRLILADGLSHAALDLGADIVIDAATLTGAQLIATGNLHAAVVSNDEHLQATLLEAGRFTGDLTWPLPFVPEFYKAEFQSPVADMRNSVKNRSNAQSSCAATFLHWHIEDTKARWAHIDLAGPAFVQDRGTGFGVALVTETVRRLAQPAADPGSDG